MYDYRIWIELAESAEQSDLGGLEKKVKTLRKLVASEGINANPEDPMHRTNSSWVFQCAVGRNHSGDEYKYIMNVLNWIVEHLPGSHGLVYLSDDEDPVLNNHIQVFVISRGRIEERLDPFLSPWIPTIEDEIGQCESEVTHTTPRVSRTRRQSGCGVVGERGNKYTYHAWIDLNQSAEDDEEDFDMRVLDNKVNNLRSLVTRRINTWPEDTVHYANGSAVFQCSADGEDWEKAYQGLMGILGWISKHLSGSYGLVYWRDDRDPKLANYYRVFAMARGVVTERMDPFLSPVVLPAE